MNDSRKLRGSLITFGISRQTFARSTISPGRTHSAYPVPSSSLSPTGCRRTLALCNYVCKHRRMLRSATFGTPVQSWYLRSSLTSLPIRCCVMSSISDRRVTRGRGV